MKIPLKKNWLHVLLFWLTCSSNIWAHENQPMIDFVHHLEPFDTYYTNCGPHLVCDSKSKYRTINGSCNNLENPLWGAIKTPYVRLGPAAFDDNDHKIRRQSDGKELPGPRELQLGIFLPRSNDLADSFNFNLMQMGQWIAHDISLMFGDLTGPQDCCAAQSLNSIPVQCEAVIKIDANDPYYSIIGKTCLPFRRAVTTNSLLNCSISPQISVNQASAFIDSSQVYGHSDDIAAVLRSNEGGKMRTELINGQEFCSFEQRNSSSLNFCDGRNNVTVCFDGGDPRHNQHFGITIFQVLFVRFHNYLANSLQNINPTWTDEQLYQEARKIVIAVLQIAVYREYLPYLIGKDYAMTTGLTILKEKKTIYDPKLMPQLAVELPAAIFRLHNQVPSKYFFVDENDAIVDDANLNEFMSYPDPIVKGSNFDYLLRGMSKMPGRCPTASYNILISNFMFQNWVSTIANQDLLSIDIQRGRDNGVLPYVEVRELCGFPKVLSYEDLRGVLSDNDILLLQKFYPSVCDVDLIVGSLLEPRIDGAMVGETARCVLADGFYRLKHGDRFFCDVEDQPGSFSPEQFDVLWNLNLTTVFCAVSTIDQLPCDIFKAGFNSAMYDCSKQLNLDLENWREM